MLTRKYHSKLPPPLREAAKAKTDRLKAKPARKAKTASKAKTKSKAKK